MTARDEPLTDDLIQRLQDWVYPRLSAKPTVAQAAAALHVPALRVAEAVGDHYWMFLTGDLSSPDTARIDADGE